MKPEYRNKKIGARRNSMKLLPEFGEIRKIAETGKYQVLPVSCEMLSDFTTPIEVMKILKNVSTHCYLLESAQANEKWGRYTFLGYDPKLEITCKDGVMKAGNLTIRTEMILEKSANSARFR